MNPRQLRRQAAKERERAAYHLKRAALLEQTAEELERLQPTDMSGMFNEHMTPEEVRARNVAISAAKATDDLAKLVRAKRKMSLNAYARELKISPGSLSLYKNGRLPVPRHVYEKVKRDTGFTAWPAGIADD